MALSAVRKTLLSTLDQGSLRTERLPVALIMQGTFLSPFLQRSEFHIVSRNSRETRTNIYHPKLGSDDRLKSKDTTRVQPGDPVSVTGVVYRSMGEGLQEQK
jgi:hypothetical protein